MARAQNSGQSGEGSTSSTQTAEKVVKYVGTADVRRISEKAWKSIGVEDQKQVEWSKRNRFTVPASDLSKGALRYLDEDDSGFVVTDKG